MSNYDAEHDMAGDNVPEPNARRVQFWAQPGSKVPDIKRDMHPDAIIGKLDQLKTQLENDIIGIEQLRRDVYQWWEEEGADPPFGLTAGFFVIEIDVEP